VLPLLLLNGTKGSAPTRSTAARLACERYALSAETSLTRKFAAVRSTSAGNSGQSFAVPVVTSAAVMTFVSVPTAA
jgi:hypothetical protein